MGAHGTGGISPTPTWTGFSTVFEPLNVASVVNHAELIPGYAGSDRRPAAGRGVKVEIHDRVHDGRSWRSCCPLRREAGYARDIVVCAGDLPAGRPSPLMMWYAMARLGVWPANRVVKVDDTRVGIGKGVAAGTWTVGVALTGNIAGLSEAELAALPPDARGMLRTRATVELEAAGADLVIDGIAELPIAVFEIERRIVAGEAPRGAGG